MASDSILLSTPYQRLFVRTQLLKHELPTEVVTVMHRDLFQKAGIIWDEGQNMDGLLCSLSRAQIDALGRVLRELDQEDDHD